MIEEPGIRPVLAARVLAAIFALLTGSCALATGQTVIRVGAFPNITHPQAMVGKSNGWFEKAMGPGVKIEWKSFNAGPSAIEALFAGAIDMTYIGPNPAISGYVRSNGEALRIVAGATSGGAALVVRNDSGIQKPEDFHGKKIASPQMGNTQDVALRAWLIAHGMKIDGQRRRCAGASAGQSGSTHALLEERTGWGMGSRTVGDAFDSGKAMEGCSWTNACFGRTAISLRHI